MSVVMTWLVPVLFMLSIGGLAYHILRTLRSGVEEYASAYTASTVRQLEDMFLFVAPQRILELAAGLAAAGFLLAFIAVGGFGVRSFFRGVAVGALAAVGGWHLPKLALRSMRRRRLRRFNEQLVDSLIGMGNALRAGFSIHQAIELVVREGRNPIAQEFAAVLHQVRVGMGLEEAFDNLRQRVGSEDLTLMISAIEVARQTGGNLPEVFEKIAHTIRGRMRIQQRVRTLTAMGRAQGVVLAVLPLVLGLLMFVVDAPLMAAFVRSPFGVGCLTVALVLEALGAWVIRKIVTIDV